MQITDQLGMMPLAYAKEIDYFAVQIIKDLDLGWLFVKENLGTPCKRFNIRCVLWKQGNDLFGEAVLAADIG